MITLREIAAVVANSRNIREETLLSDKNSRELTDARSEIGWQAYVLYNIPITRVAELFKRSRQDVWRGCKNYAEKNNLLWYI